MTIKKIPKQLKATVAFTMASMITQGLTLLVMPIFVRIMTTEQIGEVTNFNSWATLLGIIINLMLYANSYNIGMNEFANKKDQYTSFALVVSMISSIFFFIVYAIFHEFFNKIFGISTHMMFLMFIGFLFLPGTNMWLTRQRYEYKYISVLIVSITSAVLATCISTVAVLISSRIGLRASDARIFATYFITVLFGCVFTMYLLKKGKTFYSKEFLEFIIVVNTPTIIHALAKNILDVSDRIMISSLVGNSEAGIYGTLYSIITLIMILWNAIGTAILPYMFESMNNIESKCENLKHTIRFILCSFAMLTICFVLVAPEVIWLFTTSEYINAISIVPPIACGCFITSIYSIMGNVLLFNKKTSCLMKSTVIAAITNLILNAIFIPKLGYQAAAYTTIVGYIVLTIVLYREIKKIKNGTANFLEMPFVFCVSIITISIELLCYFLYPYVVVRYVIVVGILGIAFINRNRIFQDEIFQ